MDTFIINTSTNNYKITIKEGKLYINDQLHVDGRKHSVNDEPSYITTHGKYWHQHGKLHRDNDLPARIDNDGYQVWYQHGQVHRDNDKPAVVWIGHTQAWFQHGKRHRDNGCPAQIEHTDGKESKYIYWVNDKKMGEVCISSP